MLNGNILAHFIKVKSNFQIYIERAVIGKEVFEIYIKKITYSIDQNYFVKKKQVRSDEQSLFKMSQLSEYYPKFVLFNGTYSKTQSKLAHFIKSKLKQNKMGDLISGNIEHP